jgi:hypothetical protein
VLIYSFNWNKRTWRLKGNSQLDSIAPRAQKCHMQSEQHDVLFRKWK